MGKLVYLESPYAAFGTASTNQNDIGFNYSAKEHCVLLGFMSARTDLTYIS